VARRARTTVSPPPPLGSLTQVADRERGSCAVCASPRVTRLGMSLTDGTVVDFVSCHRCEHRAWSAPDGSPLSVEAVLARTRKPA